MGADRVEPVIRFLGPHETSLNSVGQWEAQLLADAAVKYKVATQMGNQGWNHEGFLKYKDVWFWSHPLWFKDGKA